MLQQVFLAKVLANFVVLRADVQQFIRSDTTLLPYYFWDPAGFTADGSVENFKRRRQTELKHGRIWAAGDAWTLPIDNASSWSCLGNATVVCMISEMTARLVDSPWYVDSKMRNRIMHALNGNSSGAPKINRAKCESSLDEAGIELLHADELTMPGDAIATTIRAGRTKCRMVQSDLLSATVPF